MTHRIRFDAVLAEAGRAPGPHFLGSAIPRRGAHASPLDIEAASSLVLDVAAVLSHAGAAAFWGLDPFTGQRPLPECSVPNGRVRGNAIVHQRRRFDHLEVVVAGALAVTSVMQTLADLGAVFDVDVVERAVESAIRLGYADDVGLRSHLTTFHPTWYRTGMSALRTVLARRPPRAAPTGSDAETVCLQHYRGDPAIPEPVRQFELLHDGRRIGVADFGFPPVPFFTEVDGLAAHGTETALAYDLNRQNRASDAQFFFRRFTAVDVYRRPRYVCRQTIIGLRLAALTSGVRLASSVA